MANEDLADLIKKLAQAGGVPITLSQALPAYIDTAAELNKKPAVPVAFPPCADELLALIRSKGVTTKDDITLFFDEYFKFGQPHIAIQGNLDGELDGDLLSCLRGDFTGPIGVSEKKNQKVAVASSYNYGGWPGECCICPPCVTLDGNRNPPRPLPNQPIPPGTTLTTPALKRLFLGDAVCLFYYERMGIFQILGAILDAFACSGRLPISNGSADGRLRDGIIGLVLEFMVRQTKTGMSSTVRDRGCMYRTSLGWSSPLSRKLNLDTVVNEGFNTLFHKFIYNALEFYRDKRLAVAIRGTATTTSPPSVATLVTVSNTINLLKKRFEVFDYGRNYYNTLSGIVWAVAGLSVIRELRTTLGIPPTFGEPHEFIPAAYDLLVLKRPVTTGESNRYLLHRDCAVNGRDILLDMEAIKHEDVNPGGILDLWLSQIEGKVEAYRTAYRTLTGVDLGASQNPVIEQQA